MLNPRERRVLKMLRDAIRVTHGHRERRRKRMDVEERVCEVCGGALDQQAAERIAKALDESPFWREMRKEPELVGLLRERRPDIFAMAIGMEVCTACREKAHREGGWTSDSAPD
jgi:tRNA U54 and U55 pseudouridine synthase Pus10